MHFFDAGINGHTIKLLLKNNFRSWSHAGWSAPAPTPAHTEQGCRLRLRLIQSRVVGSDSGSYRAVLSAPTLAHTEQGSGPPSENPGPWAERSRALIYRAVTDPKYD